MSTEDALLPAAPRIDGAARGFPLQTAGGVTVVAHQHDLSVEHRQDR